MSEVEVISVNRLNRVVIVRAGNVFLRFFYISKKEVKIVGRYKYAQQYDREALWVPDYLFQEAKKKALEALTSNSKQLELF